MAEEEIENPVVAEVSKKLTYEGAGNISDLTKNDFLELNGLLAKVYGENCVKKVKEVCDEQLSKNKINSTALYIAGMIALKDRSLDNSNLVYLVDLFEKYHKESLVEYICDEIIDIDPENKFALKKLAEFYKNANDNRVWALYEKIVKIDYEEADIAKILAERYESQGNTNTAIEYYKKSLPRFINANNMSAVKEVWTKLVSLIPEDLDFFLQIQKRIAKTLNVLKSASLMQELYMYYKNTAKWDTAIEILKIILNIDSKDPWAKKEIVECFREKYADHSRLEDYIRSSDLESSFRDIFEAISDFEKHIAFDAKSFVYHPTWKVGVIRKVQGDQLTINFGKKHGIHEMSLEMAVKSLQPLPKNHIWVLKATKKPEVLAEKVKKDIPWTLKTIIKSFGNRCDDKRIKQELVGSSKDEGGKSILTAGEWTSWHAKAQKILNSDSEYSIFAISPDDVNVYMVRDHKISVGERLYGKFKAEKDFFPRIEIFMDFLENDAADDSSEYFTEMYTYFAGYIRALKENEFTQRIEANIDEKIIAAYLLLQNVSKKISSLPIPSDFTFDQLYTTLLDKEKVTIYEALKNAKGTSLQRDFIANVRDENNWIAEYVKLFPVVCDKSMLNEILTSGDANASVIVQNLVLGIYEDYKANRNAVIYLFKECRNEEWFVATGITLEKSLITLVNIISTCYREIDNHVNTVENKKTIKAAVSLLFAEKQEHATKNNMLDYMMESDIGTITHLYTMVNDVKELEGSYKTILRNGIRNKYPDFKFQEEAIKAETPKGLLVTAKMLDVKRAEADNIEKVLLPKIAEEVSEARAKGDLKENAEYSSAKEAQHIQNVKLSKLKEELARAVVFDPSTITTSLVSFGTKVTLQNNKENKEEVLSILGPWESNPEGGIISYLSPLGDNLLDSKVGENRKFIINGKEFDYTVKAITVAQM